MIQVNIKYEVLKNLYTVDTNAKNPVKIVNEFLRTQVGQGKDYSPVEKRETYKINISLDLSEDIFSVSHNCGNKGLRDGILLNYVDVGH